MLTMIIIYIVQLQKSPIKFHIYIINLHIDDINITYINISIVPINTNSISLFFLIFLKLLYPNHIGKKAK